MNPEILKALGFEKEVKLVENKKCPFCSNLVKEDEFRDPKSLREFKISGLCQKCQDKVFGK